MMQTLLQKSSALRSCRPLPSSSSGRRFINASALTITESNDKTPMPPKETLQFGKFFSPHMLSISYSNNQWGTPEIKPLENAIIPLASACLNYGMTCFEGMKAYRTINDSDKSIRLFRPDLNMERLSKSMDRISLPGHDFPQDELIKCIAKLVELDQEYIPYGEGYSLYLRPNVIAINENLGLAIPEECLLYVMTSPVGPYYASGFKPIRLLCETDYVRASRGGTGNNKVGGNYAGAMKPSKIAVEKGYSQVLWLWDGDITEVGAMNVFFVFEKEDGRKEIVTPPLSRGDILPGVTRRSIVELANKWEDFDMVERNVGIEEVANAVKAGTLVEAFGAGTAAVVTPIECIHYNGEDLEIPATGEVTQKAWDQLLEIQYGKVEHPWSYKIDDHI